MFAGIGGFRAGLTRAGGFQCVGHCEIDKYADASYRAIHDIGKEERYYPDAREIDPGDLPDFDLLCGGFPCQAFSLAGKRKGFEDARGTLFFEIARLAQAKRPSYLLLENVPGLLSHDGGRTFSAILAALNDLGYFVEWTVLNSKHFGVPQSRRRLFIICYLDSRCAGKILPVFGTDGKALIQILHGPQGSRVYDTGGVACTQTASAGGMGGKTGLYLVQPAHASFVDLCAGEPRQTKDARCITARYGDVGTPPVIRTKEAEPAGNTGFQTQPRQHRQASGHSVKTKDSYVQGQAATQVTELPPEYTQGKQAFIRERGRLSAERAAERRGMEWNQRWPVQATERQVIQNAPQADRLGRTRQSKPVAAPVSPGMRLFPAIWCFMTMTNMSASLAAAMKTVIC